MTKRQIIDEIVSMNQTAKPAFLASFGEDDLNDYLKQLQRLRQPRLLGDASRFERYFAANNSSQAQACTELRRQESSVEEPSHTQVELFDDSPHSARHEDCRDTRWRTGPDLSAQKVSSVNDDHVQPGLF